MNAAARLVCCAWKYEHIILLLRDLHWLRVPERIEFKLYVCMVWLRHTWRASYVVWRTWIQERGCDLRRRLPLSHHLRVVRRLVTARSSSLRRVPGTLCHPASLHLTHSATFKRRLNTVCLKTAINRNPPQSTGIHRNQPESTTKPPKSTA